MLRPFILAEASWDEIRTTRFEVAVLPWGATEAHNRHLPYATDTVQSDQIAAESARKAWELGAKVLVLPTVPFGVQTGQADIPYCLNMNPSTQTHVLRDLIRSMAPHGVRKLVILNGHGGNDFKQIIRELQPETSILLCQVHWFKVIDPTPLFSEPGDHAGELETSLMQAIAPENVRPLNTAGPGAARPFAVPAFREGWAWTQRVWSQVTDDTGVGNPQAASADKGARYLTAVTDRIAEFLRQLAAVDPADLYSDQA